MAAFVVLVTALLTVVAVAATRSRLGLARSWREVVALSAMLLFTYVAIVTEGLSLFGSLTRQPILIAWCTLAVAAIAVTIANRKNLLEWSLRPSRPVALQIVPIAAITSILAITLLTICLCPPNNWDVILYHLPRQVQWLQQGSVAHFPTQDYRLTVNPPLAEYLGLHLMALGDSDRLNSLVSWSALGLTLLAVSLLARDLGVNRLGQWIAAAFAATIPMGIHEAVSGKNDGLVAFWLVMATWWLLKLWNAERLTRLQAAFFGTTLGLLALTKGTGAVFALPIVLIALLQIARRRPEGWLASLTVAMVIALALNAGHCTRNYRHYGSFEGKTFGLGNERHDLNAVASNLLRNLTMHMAGPQEKRNRAIERFVDRQHQSLGLSLDDAQTSWGGQQFHLEYAPQKEHATASFHLILPGLAALAMLATCRRQTRAWGLYWIVLLGGGCAFCFVFKWQPWHPRLHLPLFSLAGVAVGWLLSRHYIRVASPMIVASLVGSSLPALIASEYRTLWGSTGLNLISHDAESLRFEGRDDIRESVQRVVERLENAGSVDLVNHGALPWEYPLTRLLKNGHNSPRVSYFYPVAGSPATEAADAVIAIGDQPGPALIRHATGRIYRAEEVIGPFTLYRPVPTGAPIGEGAILDHAVGRFGIGAEPPAHR